MLRARLHNDSRGYDEAKAGLIVSGHELVRTASLSWRHVVSICSFSNCCMRIYCLHIIDSRVPVRVLPMHIETVPWIFQSHEAGFVLCES
jgi:hypothetical protein